VLSLKLVKSRESGANTGTGFVKFEEAGVARELGAYSKKMGESIRRRQQMPSSLFSLEFNGSLLEVHPALRRGQLQEEEARRTDKVEPPRKLTSIQKCRTLEDLQYFDQQGKRQLSLALVGSEPRHYSSQRLYEQRVQDKLEKLKNPNMVVSATRLILRNLPRTGFGQAELRQFVQSFIVADQGRARFRAIKFCKLMEEREGRHKGMTKGFGFVEFSSPELALRFTEYVQDYAGQHGNGWFAEFCIQDSRRLRKMAK
jgi:RNA recognition motif-containing protein